MKRFSTAVCVLIGTGLLPVPVSAGPGDAGQSSAPGGAENSEELGRAAQRELARLGCFSGDAAGSWGRESRAAVKRFNQTSQTAWPDWPAADMIGSLRTYADGFCSAAASVAPEKKPATSSVAKLPAEPRLEERPVPVPVPVPAPVAAVETKPEPPVQAPSTVTAVEKKPELSAPKTGTWQPAETVPSAAPAADGQMFTATVEKAAPKANTAKPPAAPVKAEPRNYVMAPNPPVAPPAPVVASAPEVPVAEAPAQQPAPRSSWVGTPNLDGR